jgi:septum formation protein
MIQAAAPALILASESASRRELLQSAGIEFATRPAHIDEISVKQSAQSAGTTAANTAILLAELKAARVSARTGDAVVIGADQILVCDGVWFDKPASPAEAREHLLRLRGRMHMLVTGIVCMRNGTRVWHHVAQPRLTMRAFSDAFLDDYIAVEGEALMQTVGAYRLEGRGVHLFDRIEGEHAAILGLPLLPLFGFLRQHGVLGS